MGSKRIRVEAFFGWNCLQIFVLVNLYSSVRVVRDLGSCYDHAKFWCTCLNWFPTRVLVLVSIDSRLALRLLGGSLTKLVIIDYALD
nr:hypothetical protein [Tanacetum cinerariifolium]